MTKHRTQVAPQIALYWDKSFLWGLIAYRTFLELGIDFELLSAADIRAGRLDGFDVVFVPGGWASDKSAALGPEGQERLRAFVGGGGGYLGFCGGAGLALDHSAGLSLAPVGRMPASVRLPSFSGPIALKQSLDHPLWQGVTDGAPFHAWWPAQFSLGDDGSVKVLARYGSPAAGSFVTDLMIDPLFDWNKWEQSYGTNLNPERIVGEPAVIEAAFGQGKVILSYPHFETPDDSLGHQVLLNALAYLAGKELGSRKAPAKHAGPFSPTDEEVRRLAATTAAAAERFIRFGHNNFLWYWRNSWLLQWRRGVKGIEYCTVYAMLKEINGTTARLGGFEPDLKQKLARLQELVDGFFEQAKRLLLLERFAMNYGPISPLKSDDREIQAVRTALFSDSKRCGGLYEEILNQADDVLLPLLRAAK